MKIATFNAASVRARLELILDWLAETEPDVLAIQETKCEDHAFPRGPFEELGYQVNLHGIKAWNGVATISRHPATTVRQGFDHPDFPQDGRVLSCQIDGIEIVNTYVPNGSAVGSEKWEYKLRWLDHFHRFLLERYRPDQPLVWLGDVNIAPTSDDVYNPSVALGGIGHHPIEFERLRRIVGFGLTDLFRKFHEGPGHYTWWDYVNRGAVERNQGWRIDHIYATAPVVDRCRSCVIDVEPRTRLKPSDHTFVVAEID